MGKRIDPIKDLLRAHDAYCRAEARLQEASLRREAAVLRAFEGAPRKLAAAAALGRMLGLSQARVRQMLTAARKRQRAETDA